MRRKAALDDGEHALGGMLARKDATHPPPLRGRGRTVMGGSDRQYRFRFSTISPRRREKSKEMPR